MEILQQLDALRTLWKTADDEERHAIQITARALKIDEPRNRDVVNCRVAAHHRHQGKPFDMPDQIQQMKLF